MVILQVYLAWLNFVCLVHVATNQFSECASKDTNIKPTIISGFHPAASTILTTGTVCSYLECFARCSRRVDCDFAVWCAECYLVAGNALFGNEFRSIDNAVPSCSVFAMNTRCANGGTFFNGMCHCSIEFTGITCERNVKDYCKTQRWDKVYASDQLGDVIHGNLQSLITSVSAGLEHKVLVKDLQHQTWYTLETHGSGGAPALVFGRTYEFLEFNNTAFRTVKEITSNGNISTWQLKLNSTETSIANSVKSVEWWAVRYVNSTPCLVSDMDFGSSDVGEYVSVFGSSEDCLHSLQNGSDLYLTLHSQYHAESVDLHSSNLQVQVCSNLNHTYMYINNTFRLTNNRYAVIKYSKGQGVYLKWSIPQQGLNDYGVLQDKTQWYLDECWNWAFSYNQYKPSNGSLQYLRAAVLNGKQLRVVYNNTASRVQEITIGKFGDVHATLMEMFNRTSYTADSTVHGVRFNVSTNGRVSIYSHLWETDRMHHSSTSYGNTSKWYVESREWVKIVSFNSLSHITYGTLEKLFEVIINSLSLRIVIAYPGGSYHALGIKHTRIFNNSYFFMDTGTLQSVFSWDASTVRCEQWAGRLDSRGLFQKTYWTTGSKLTHARVTSSYVQLDVFYQNLTYVDELQSAPPANLSTSIPQSGTFNPEQGTFTNPPTSQPGTHVPSPSTTPNPYTPTAKPGTHTH